MSYSNSLQYFWSPLDIPTNNSKECFSCFPQRSVVVFNLIKETYVQWPFQKTTTDQDAELWSPVPADLQHNSCP